MAFYVGQKVVCVKDEGQTQPPYCVKGQVYTINHIKELLWYGTGLEFVELGPCAPGGCFPAIYFKPIVSRPTSISIFTTMLGPTKVREDA